MNDGLAHEQEAVSQSTGCLFGVHEQAPAVVNISSIPDSRQLDWHQIYTPAFEPKRQGGLWKKRATYVTAQHLPD